MKVQLWFSLSSSVLPAWGTTAPSPLPRTVTSPADPTSHPGWGEEPAGEKGSLTPLHSPTPHPRDALALPQASAHPPRPPNEDRLHQRPLLPAPMSTL